MKFDKWFNKQSRLVQLVLLLIPGVNWITELLVRVSRFLRTKDGKDLIVYGANRSAGKIDSFNDHRITMSASIMATTINGETIIYGAEAVNKSYPTFFDDLRYLGGNVIEI